MNANRERCLLAAAISIGVAHRQSLWIRILRGICALLAACQSLGQAAQSVTLAWDPNSEPNIAGYELRYGTTRGTPAQIVDVGKKTTATVSNLADATTYYFTVVARNTLGLKSPPSNEVPYTTRALGSHKLTVINGTGTGSYTEGTLVPVSANPPPIGQKFERWIGDYQILVDSPSTMRTKALMLFRDLRIEATYSASDTIRYWPRKGWAARMKGGVFEGTNGHPVTGPYVPIHTISSVPIAGWTEVQLDLGKYRYLRYRGPAGSYGNVAEIEFYRAGVRLTGAGFGTPGSWSGKGDTFAMALDGNPATYFDGPTANGNFVGIDTASRATDFIRFYPRSAFTRRMVGGIFEGTNGNPMTGPYTRIYTITTEPLLTWAQVSVNLGSFRYLRYRGPNGSHGNVAEIEFYRGGIKVKGVPFGTAGSWNGRGNTFQKAFDSNVGSFFDAPAANGNFAGIDTVAGN